MVVKRIGVWSVARIYGALMAAVGLFVGLMVVLFSLAGAGLAGQVRDTPSWLFPILGVGAIVIAPIMYGILGLIVGTVSALLYNIFASLVGGVTLETE